MNKHWTRWIMASINTHFSSAITLPYFIEGMDRETKDLTSFVEIRMDGPWFLELSANYWRVYIEVNIMIHTVMNDEDLYQHVKNIGNVTVAFQECISAYKYGNGDDDDDSQLGCLQLVVERNDREQTKISNFGQIDKSVKLQQATVEAHYEMFLDV